MSPYTTGEIAKLCGVTVRTVQYYDTRGILSPSALSEGGRRLYSEEDLRRLRIICFLRELDLPIHAIGQLLSEEDPASVIELLLEQQQSLLREELTERQTRLQRLEELRRGLRSVEHFSVESIGDIACQMENKMKLRRVHAVMLAVGLVAEAVEIATLMLWILRGIWWPYAVGMAAVIAASVWIVRYYYYRRVAYICPKCHTVFRPRFREMFWASHTPSTRRLTCTECGHKGFCVEVYGGDTDENG